MVYWSPIKRCKLALLSEDGYSYEEVGRQIGGNLIKYANSKYLKRFYVSLQNKPEKYSKHVKEQVMKG